MEAFDLIHALNLADNPAPIIHLEKRKYAGTEHLYLLIYALKLKVKLLFSYQKYWDDKISKRSVQPYELKEFKNRWYLLANDNKGGKIKSFWLDRIKDLIITDECFELSTNFNPEDMCKYCLGIMNADEGNPQ